jgi:chemotaxis protein CheZ
MNSVDDVDLEALFDEVAAQRVVELTSTPASTPARGPAASPLPSAAHADGAHCAEREPDEDMFERIGRLTRNVHNALRDLGYDKTFEKMVDASADTRTRLSYVSDLTRQAAERVLGAIEAAKPIQQALGSEALELHAKWERVIAGQSNVDEFRELALRTNQFLSSTGERAEQTGEHLLNIMMAQDFHDLTGQVIKRIVGRVGGISRGGTTARCGRRDGRCPWLERPGHSRTRRQRHRKEPGPGRRPACRVGILSDGHERDRRGVAARLSQRGRRDAR